MAETVQSVDPRTGQAGPTYPASTPSDVRAAVAASAQAVGSPAWRDDKRRAAFLRGAAARLREADAEIVALVQSETGLPEGRAGRRARAHLRASSRRSPTSSTRATTSTR